MSRHFAFLRAINVGGHTVKMEPLRQLFTKLGFTNVETFIASGNVIFESSARNSGTLERKIEQALHDALGYEVATFIRSSAELTAIVNYQPFPKRAMETAGAFNVAFLGEGLDPAAKRNMLTLRTDIDDFHVHGRELYWLCRNRQSESTFSGAVCERAIGQRATLRGINTIRKMVAKYP